MIQGTEMALAQCTNHGKHGGGRGTGRDVKFRLDVKGKRSEVRKLWGWSQGVAADSDHALSPEKTE